MKNIVIKGLDTIDEAAKEFLQEIGDNKIIALYGSMGAGKTTFVTALCRVLGVEDVVNSPTFTIVNEYQTEEGEPVFHFDFYRIKSLREVEDLGFEEYVYSDCLCLMEWPEMIEEMLPEETVKVSISEQEDGTRLIKFI
ncbi:MAG: tRNA (adenosine(37)-N6)-threonylcarbamoyltransferase complex ATPase subunit type 1 TsaE [Bacteroidales bacterium]|jgi:tRNA threonylcarbamoyladenosine biosynthesis protein TsaE|nr:tRNA (adenosine(37)-N6)-threonylcarbamoyltransferase complex ATPase subunit type 1 TsaE [Bacteroidales bacterium]